MSGGDGLCGEDGASEEDEGDEGEEDEPYAVCDPEALLLEAGGGLLWVLAHVDAGRGGEGDVGDALAHPPLHGVGRCDGA